MYPVQHGVDEGEEAMNERTRAGRRPSVSTIWREATSEAVAKQTVCWFVGSTALHHQTLAVCEVRCCGGHGYAST